MTTSHEYSDFSKMSYENAVVHFKPQKSTQVLFPVKLHYIIDHAIAEGCQDIVSWTPHGRAFKIHNEALFLSKIIFKFFFIRKMANFKRQLGVYGFRRIRSKNTEDTGAYFHELFLRQRPELCIGIFRVNNRTSVKNHANEPNLTEFDPMAKTSSTNNQNGDKIKLINCKAINPPFSSHQFSPSNAQLYSFGRQMTTGSTCVVSSQHTDITSSSSSDDDALINVTAPKEAIESSDDDAAINITARTKMTEIVIRPIVRMGPSEEGAGVAPKQIIHSKPSTYRDFLNVPDDEIIGHIKRARQEVFPVKLHRLIENSKAEGYSNIISWQQNGRSFKIHNTNKFLKEVVNRVFAVTNFAFFVRQLGLYGFQKIVEVTNADQGSYFHEYFMRGRPGLCIAIMKQVKRSLIDRGNEPDFSHYEAVPENLKTSVIPSPSKSTSPSKPSQIDSNKSSVDETATLIPQQPPVQPKIYHDYLNLTDKQVIGNFKPKRQLFPEKLYKLIELSQTQNYSHIVSWLSHGRSFKIHDEKRFLTHIVNRVFCVSSMKFFIKQLGQYGFQKIAGLDNGDKGAFFHELFLRGRPGLCAAIIKQKKRLLVDKSSEPNFALYDPMHCTISTTMENVTTNSQNGVTTEPMVYDDKETNNDKAAAEVIIDTPQELMELEKTNEKLNVAVALFQLKNQLSTKEGGSNAKLTNGSSDNCSSVNTSEEDQAMSLSSPEVMKNQVYIEMENEILNTLYPSRTSSCNSTMNTSGVVCPSTISFCSVDSS